MRTAFISAVLLFSACEPKALEFTARAVESLPQHSVPRDGLTSGLSIATEVQLRQFFRQECQQPGEVNYCPKTVDVSANGGINDFKFTTTALLGFIYHAQIYTGGLHEACRGTKRTVTASALRAEAADGGEPGRYVLDAWDHYDCLELEKQSGDRFTLASTVAGHQSTLVTRFKEAGMTDLFQIEVSLDSQQTPTFLALNWAGVSSMAARAVLLVNLRTHRFAVKYLTGPAGQEQFVVAVGVGGVDRTTGAGHPGFYRTSFTDEMRATKHACVDNGTQLLEIDDTECVAGGVPIAWTSADAIATWVGLTEEERTRLAPWLTKFADAQTLPFSETPSGQADVDRYFPRGIQ